jgi:site-specific recombinase XerD
MSNDQIVDEWLGNQRSEHTREAYAADINKALAFLEDKPLAEVTLRDLQRYATFLYPFGALA